METTRKKIINKELWKRNINKCDRYKSKELPKVPGCDHSKKKQAYKCSQLTLQDIRRFYQAFYATNNKIEQDHFILEHLKENIPKRRRGQGRKNNITLQYFFNTRKNGLQQVCSKAFLGVLNISRFRVQNIAKKFMIEGMSPKERRGGDKKSTTFIARKNNVRNFLRKLEFVESHYTREKSVRKYLPSDCSVKKLWRIYNKDAQSERLEVKYQFFLRIFNYEFNISFKSPATDACSECISLKSIISVTPSGKKKEELMAKFTVHKMKYRAFYDMLRSDEGSQTLRLSFDCQKNQVLPKIPDQAANYSRQLYIYNFTICVGNSKNTQDPSSVFCYSWCENQRPKGSNEIASIIFYHLNNTELTGIKEIELFCDGCPGQNKNMIVVGMLCKFMHENKTNLEKVTMVFPVVGHSFLPPDRVFGRIEKKIKKVDTLVKPEEYLKIFEEFGTLRKVGDEVPIHDWKGAVASTIKPAGNLNFKFAQCKRLIITKTKKNIIMLEGEIPYKSNISQPRGVLKKGKTFQHLIPEMLPNTVKIKQEKLQDVENLLKKHFGEEWREFGDLSYYQRILDDTVTPVYEEPIPDEVLTFEEDEDLRI